MMRHRLSAAAAGLMRSLIARAGNDRDRIVLSHWSSTDWQSLMFVGERHEVELRVCGPRPDELLARLTDGLGEAEISIPDHFLADIASFGAPVRQLDGSLLVSFEALTISD